MTTRTRTPSERVGRRWRTPGNAEGKSNKKVATLLNVSVYTVETYRTHIRHKLDLHNTAEIVLYAARKEISS